MAEVAAATGARTLAVAADVTDRAVDARPPREVVEELGQVDLLVNNAGLIDEFEVPLWETDPDQWWDVVTSHVRGGFLLCRTVVPWMLLRNRGRVVNLASGMSVRARPEYSAYSVAKTGLMRVTEALAGALEGADVRAFDVAPGVVETEMTRAMPMWKGFTDWTPPEKVVELVAAIAAGELDQWTGRYLRAGKDDVAALRDRHPDRRRPATPLAALQRLGSPNLSSRVHRRDPERLEEGCSMLGTALLIGAALLILGGCIVGLIVTLHRRMAPGGERRRRRPAGRGQRICGRSRARSTVARGLTAASY